MSRFTVALALGGLLCAQPSQADPVVVTRGGLSIDFLGGDNSFGFGTDASPFLFGGVLMDSYVLVVPPGSALGCTRSAPCFANDRLSLSGTESGSGFAIVGLDSTQRPITASFQFTSKGALLDGEAVALGYLQNPFEFTGWLRIYSDFSFGQIVSETALTGRGTARLWFFQPGEPPFSPSGPFLRDEVQYRFAAPVPEPATIVLLTIGLAAACATRRRAARAPGRRSSHRMS